MEKSHLILLANSGLIYKANNQFYHYEAVRKYCQDYVIPEQIETQIQTVLNYYTD